MQIHGLHFAAALLVFSVAISRLEGQECANGSTMCEGIPFNMTVGNELLCCTSTSQRPVVNQTGDKLTSCSCVDRTPENELEKKIRAWAIRTDVQGRMCQYGEDGCRGSKSNDTINRHFKFCCRKNYPVETHITSYDGTSFKYIGCRCVNDHIPTNPDPQAYIVPQTGQYNTTGESCSYNELCNDNPSLKCESPNGTLCCYGSRGMQLTNNGNVTRCTCTHELFGKNCTDIKPIPGSTPIPSSKITCMQECTTVNDFKKKCVVDGGQERCCPPPMIVNATIHNGNFTSCMCSLDLTEAVCREDTGNGAQDMVRSVVGLMAVTLLALLVN